MTTNSFAYGDTGGTIYNFLAEFSVGIPAGATINSAVITFESTFANSSDTCNIRIHGSLDAFPTNYASAAALTLGANSVDWNAIGHFSAATHYDTPDITGVLQDAVNDAGWTSGDPLLILFKNNASSSGAFRNIRVSTTIGSGFLIPSLAVDFTP